ncbi:MAG: hypothetical protein NT018_13550, partial [Armatimonadetes bacterium]|nr:hypothetical protein [Armatimonadota bacterium]
MRSLPVRTCLIIIWAFLLIMASATVFCRDIELVIFGGLGAAILIFVGLLFRPKPDATNTKYIDSVDSLVLLVIVSVMLTSWPM